MTKSWQYLTDHLFSDYGPVFSPDDRKIAFSSVRDFNSEVYVMDTDGKNQENRTNHWGSDASPSWSPDGQKIVFSSWRDGLEHLYLADASGANVVQLTRGAGRNFGAVWFDPSVTRFVSSKGRAFLMWGWLRQMMKQPL